MDLKKMMEQAQQMQSRLQKELEQVVVEGDAGGGMVRIKMNGKKELLSIYLDPEAFAAGDRELLQDLIKAAFNQCSRKLEESLTGRLGALAGELKLPGLFQ